MKKTKSSLALLVITLLSVTGILAQQNTAIDTTYQGKPMLYGHVTKSDYLQAPFNDWFESNYDDYSVTRTAGWKNLKSKLDQYKITIYMATWCGDSRREVPRLIKILEALDYDMIKLDIVAMNQLKQDKNRQERGESIHRVPTLILTKNGKEKGRIVESPIESLEVDLHQIITYKSYQSNYYGIEVLHKLIENKGIDYLISHQPQVIKKVKPHFESAYELRKYGVIYSRDNQLDDAILIARLNKALFPYSDVPLYSLGKYHAAQQEYDKAIDYLEQAIAINPDNKNAKNVLETLKAKASLN